MTWIYSARLHPFHPSHRTHRQPSGMPGIPRRAGWAHGPVHSAAMLPTLAILNHPAWKDAEAGQWSCKGWVKGTGW